MPANCFAPSGLTILQDLQTPQGIVMGHSGGGETLLHLCMHQVCIQRTTIVQGSQPVCKRAWGKYWPVLTTIMGLINMGVEPQLMQDASKCPAALGRDGTELRTQNMTLNHAWGTLARTPDAWRWPS